MKTSKAFLLLVSTIVVSSLAVCSYAQEARFFRIAGPVATSITEFTTDGYITWTNAPTNAIFTVQTTTSLGNATNWVDYVQIPATNGDATNVFIVIADWLIDYHPPSGMALIPAGSFTMGDSLDGQSSALPLHTVYVSAFYMEKYEVTKALWNDVYQWATNHSYSFDYISSGQGKTGTHPAQSLSWYDAVKWCNARSEKEGRTPAYYTSAGQTNVYRTGQINVNNSSVKWNQGYRLPTEAEWEKAARGGASGQRFPWGNTIKHSQANYQSRSDYAYDVSPTRGYHPMFNDGVNPYTSPAGYFAPNGYGLYDMVGNIEEWCWDWNDSTWYSNTGATQPDPQGPISGSSRIVRGGSWGGQVYQCPAARRGSLPANSHDILYGFRCVLPPCR